jgi:hypothetical protein
MSSAVFMPGSKKKLRRRRRRQRHHVIDFTGHSFFTENDIRRNILPDTRTK